MVSQNGDCGGASKHADDRNGRLRLIGWAVAAIAVTTLQTLPTLAAEHARQAPHAAPHAGRANGHAQISHAQGGHVQGGRVQGAAGFRAPVARGAFAPAARNRVYFNGGVGGPGAARNIARAVPNVRPSNYAPNFIPRPFGGMRAAAPARAYGVYRGPAGGPAPYVSVSAGPAIVGGLALAGFGYLYDSALAAPYVGLSAWQMPDYAQLSEPQVREQQNAMIDAVAAPIDDEQGWADGAASGSVTPIREGQTADGRKCREFRQIITVDGETEEGVGTACQDEDGSWQVVRDDDDSELQPDDQQLDEQQPPEPPLRQPFQQPASAQPSSIWHDPAG